MSIADYINIFRKQRRIILFNVITITLLSILISLIIPKRYTSTAKILPPAKLSMYLGISPQYSMQLPSLPGLQMFGASPSFILKSIIESRSVKEAIIDKFNLMEVYKCDKKVDAIEKLTKHTKIEISPAGVIEISVTEKTPELAKNIADEYINQTNKVLIRICKESGRYEREFLEKRLKELEKEMKCLEDTIVMLQKKHGVLIGGKSEMFALGTEVEAAIDILAKLKSELIVAEIERDYLKTQMKEDNPLVKEKELYIANLQDKIKEMEEKGKGSFGIGFSLPLSDVPPVAMKLTDLLFKLKVDNQVYIALKNQWELARLNEIRDIPALQVLDYPDLPEVKSFPRRKLIVMLSFAFSLFLGMVLAIINEKMEGGDVRFV